MRSTPKVIAPLEIFTPTPIVLITSDGINSSLNSFLPRKRRRRKMFS
jgi:hypothetical protein